MRLQAFTLICAVAVSNMLPAFAQAGTLEDNSSLYMDAMALPKKATVCAARMTDFKVKFDPAFAKWRSANKVQLTAGEAQLRADAKAKNIPFPSNIEVETDSVAQFLQSAGDSTLKERCTDILVQVGAK